MDYEFQTITYDAEALDFLIGSPPVGHDAITSPSYFLAYFIHTHIDYEVSVKRRFTCFLSTYKLVMGLFIHTRWLQGSSQTSLLCYVW